MQRQAPAFPPHEYRDRIRRVEAALDRASLDALIAYSVSNQPGPVGYLGGYEPSFGRHDVAFFVVAPRGKPECALLTNAFWDRPQERTWTSDVFVTGDLGKTLAELLPGSAKRIGIAGYRFFPLPVYRVLRRAFPDVVWVDATPVLQEVAKIKSPLEIEIMRQVARMTQAGGEAFLRCVQEGTDERLLVADVERAMFAAGADGLSFPTILMTGPQVITSIGFACHRPLVRGQQVNILCGARYLCYGDELARVTTVGPPRDEVRAIMETAAEMHEAMQQRVGPGIPAADVAQASIAVARKHGLEDFLFKSINSTSTQGHGMGCWYLEPPGIHPDSKDILEANMVVILESRLGKPRVGGAVITEPWLVTSHGAERLSSLDIRTWHTQAAHFQTF